MISGGVRNIDLGASNAEADARLAEYFVTTPYVEEGLGGRKTLFLGRKGSGKSALFREFPRLLGESRSDMVTVSLTPDEYLWDALRRYREAGLSEAAAHRNAWKLTLAVQIAAQLANQNFSAQSDGERAAETLRKFLKDNFGDAVLPAGGVVRVLRDLRSFNLSAFGFGAGVTKDGHADGEITPGVIAKLTELIRSCLDQVGLVVLIDRLDEEWDGTPEAERLLIALLMVSKELND
jgi:energy-coupling factor transporter ATP-binding protein EcfA2